MQTASQSEPVRQSDFVNSSSARGEWMEELSALAKLRPDSSIELFNWGYLLHLRSSSQFLEWYLKRPNTQQLLLLETIELDGFGTRLSLNKKIADLPFATYGTVCSWPPNFNSSFVPKIDDVSPEGVPVRVVNRLRRAVALPPIRDLLPLWVPGGLKPL